jgi:antirestriction factor ArdC-like protein
MMRAYSLFWNYSLGNQLLALLQAHKRRIPLGPIASFNRWNQPGRYVKRGEKAIELCMPVTVIHEPVEDCGARAGLCTLKFGGNVDRFAGVHLVPRHVSEIASRCFQLPD